MVTPVMANMYRVGLRVSTPRGIVEITGRNGCYSWQWLGHPIVNGKADTNRIRIIDSRKPVAIVTGDGEQYILGG
ncbi:MAG: hypothetical protein R3Y11_07910 [Pseudomonadota bacterium]